MKVNLSSMFKSVQTVVTKHSPEILTGIGIAGMITTTVLAVKATPKAMRLIEASKEDPEDKLTPVETVKATWKCYIPAAVTGTLSVACLIGASSVHLKRNTALATAYKLSETALTEYREKVVETVGEKKERSIREKVSEEQVKKQPPVGNQIIVTGNGDSECYDPMSGRYFTSSFEKIKTAQNKLNEQMIHDLCGYASLNDLYDELGLSHTEIGDYMGWSTSELINIEITPIVTERDRPALAMYYVNRPKYGYDD